MSDHYTEAWDQWQDMGCPSPHVGGGGGSGLRTPTPTNHNYYHCTMVFDSIEYETEKLILFRFKDKPDLWIPRKICKEFNLDLKTVLVHTEILRKIRLRVKK